MPYVFDAYGTLFDFHAAVSRHHAAAGPDAALFSEVWRQKQIEYTWTHTLAGRYVEFWTLTQRALDYCFERFPSVDRKLRGDLLDAYLKLDAFPDARKVLRAVEGARRAHRHPDQRLAGDGRRGGRGGRPQGRARRGALGRHRQDVQAAPRGLCAGHPGVLVQARRTWCSCPRTAGTPWARPHSASARSGSTAPRRRTNIPIFPRRRWCPT